jgi:hypothetical protein
MDFYSLIITVTILNQDLDTVPHGDVEQRGRLGSLPV